MNYKNLVEEVAYRNLLVKKQDFIYNNQIIPLSSVLRFVSLSCAEMDMYHKNNDE